MKFDGREDQMEMLREIADNILDPVFLVDRSFNVWYFNRAFEAAVGVRMSSKRYKDRPCHELLGLSICKDACVMKQVVATNQVVRLAEIPGKTAGCDQKNFHINAIPVQNVQGAPFGSLIFLRDITAETEIHEKYKQLVARNSNISLSGQIEAGNLVDVVQLFVFLQKTGQLSLKHGAEQGAIVFERGRMVGIVVGDAEGEKALDRMLSWQDGAFSFGPMVKVTIEHPITGSTDFMLMNVVRERDELSVHATSIPDFGVKLEVLRIASEDEGIEPTAWRVYEAAVEGRTIEHMIKTLPDPDSRILNALFHLRDKQIVRW